MTSKIYSAVLAGTAVLAVTLGATTASAATAQADAHARVLQALTLTKVDDLDFGAIVTDPTNPGTVAIDASGNRTCGGAISCSGSVGAADFTLGGSGNEIVGVSLPSGTVTLNSGGNSMTATLSLSSATVTLDGLGAGSVSVGGTLSVAAAQAQGVYTGTFDVEADYQ